MSNQLGWGIISPNCVGYGPSEFQKPLPFCCGSSEVCLLSPFYHGTLGVPKANSSHLSGRTGPKRKVEKIPTINVSLERNQEILAIFLMALFLDQQHLAIVTPYQHGCKAGPLVLPSTMISPSYSPGYTIFGITAYVNFLDLKGSCGVNQGSTWFSRLFFVVVFTGILSTNSPRTPVVWVLGGEK